MTDRSAIDRDSARVRADQQRAARQADRNTRKLGASVGGRRGSELRLGRSGARAPGSASTFHHNRKYSNRARAHRAPGSAASKIKYDFRLDRAEDQRDDLDYAYICAPDGTPESALDPVAMAYASEAALGRKATMRARIMAHETIALPASLNKEQRHSLIRKLADLYQHTMGVPIYCAAHKPDKGSANNHLHLSHPLRHVHDDGRGGFRLGNKIMFEQQAQVRRDARLPPTNHGELKSLRMQIAATIANEMEAAGIDKNECERWRWGHLKLHQQVQKAAERGDVEFVNDNVNRDPTRHEGPNTKQWRAESNDIKRTFGESHNDDSATGEAGPELLTRTLLTRILDQADKAGISNSEHLRMLARDHGLKVEWVRAKGGKDAAVTGVRVQMQGGPAMAGKQVGASLHDLKRRFAWDAVPAYARYPAKSGPEFDKYTATVKSAGLNVTPGQPRDLLPNALAAVAKDAGRLKTQAAQAAPEGEARVPAAPAVGGEAHTHNDFQHVPQEDSMTQQYNKPKPNDPNDQLAKTADAVANVAGSAKFVPGLTPVAAAIETGARVVQLGVKIDQATTGLASKAASPMSGIKGISGGCVIHLYSRCLSN